MEGKSGGFRIKKGNQEYAFTPKCGVRGDESGRTRTGCTGIRRKKMLPVTDGNERAEELKEGTFKGKRQKAMPSVYRQGGNSLRGGGKGGAPKNALGWRGERELECTRVWDSRHVRGSRLHFSEAHCFKRFNYSGQLALKWKKVVRDDEWKRDAERWRLA